MKNRKEKILISIIGFTQGGAEIFPIRLANFLYRQNIDVMVHAINDQEEAFVRNMLDPDIKVFKCSSRLKFIRLLMKEKITVVHTHCNANQLLVARSCKIAPWLRIRHIATCHGIYEGIDYELAKEQILCCDPYVKYWTYVADNNYATLKKVGITEEKCKKIGNSMEYPDKITPIEKKKYNIPEDAKVVTVISRAVGKKSWIECIHTITKAREQSGLNIHLILGGLGEYYELLTKKGVPDYIHLAGAVTKPCDYYAASDLGMLLSKIECAPLGLIEMYYTNTPVVATDTGDVREMMTTENGTTGIVVSLNADGSINENESAAAVIKMLTNSEYYQKCVDELKIKSRDFSMEKVGEKYLNLYRK